MSRAPSPPSLDGPRRHVGQAPVHPTRGNRPIAVITGATSGLGRITAFELARRGYRLGVVARSRSKADTFLSELRSTVGDAEADVFHADHGLVSQARRVGEEIAARYPRLDVLVNNAGLHAFSQRITAEGVAELTAVNYLGPFALTQALTHTLSASGPAHIVNVASEAARQAGTVSPARDLRHTAPGQFPGPHDGHELRPAVQRHRLTPGVGAPVRAPASSSGWRPIRRSRTPAEATSPYAAPSPWNVPSPAVTSGCRASCGRRR
ncbi:MULTISPECIES: SDR family NAD(P)-dependent oxidoreductase [Streptomyces]|uniref:SDR family NAD(P)-dependent oxidoreductase n=1 Tax=Streptomyces TaxID=1883 RepID=UPI00340AE032